MRIHFEEKFTFTYIDGDDNDILNINDYELILISGIDIVLRYENIF